MGRLIGAVAFVVMSLTCVNADAALVVTVGNLSLPVGGQGHVDVLISSDNGDSLSAFFDTFVINVPGLKFGTGPNEPDDLQLANPHYVFPLADSTSAAFPPAGVINGTNFANDTYLGFDSTSDGAGITVPATGALLVTLHVVATTAHPGDAFLIGLDPVNSSFFDPNFNSIAFSGVAGEVRITGPATVPEPATGGMWLLGIGMFGVSSARRLRHTAKA